ncbi:MAG: septal ring lytic transglycosylase RlpA family protein, partial [Candidatus Binataceae bacterium]
MRATRFLGALALTVITLAFESCATTRSLGPPAPPVAPGSTSVRGVASWYGPGFNGRRTSSGALYDQEAMTAASTRFPLGSRIRVTNLSNSRAVKVIINDHGPYVKGRDLDLSHGAARALGMVGKGTAHVRMDVLQTPAGGPALGQRYFVQVGSYATAANASLMRARLAANYPDVSVIAASGDAGRVYR